MRKGKTAKRSKDTALVKIKVEPRSSRPGIAGPHGDALKVRLKSPPVDGKANKELIEVLSEAYGIHKQDIEIVSGQSSRNKVVKFTGVKRPDGLKQR